MALLAAMTAFAAPALAQQAVPFGGLNLSNGKEPVQINADRLEMRDKEGLAIFTGNVSVVQGQTVLKSGKMTVYFSKAAEKDAKSGDKTAAAQPQAAPGLGAAGIDHLEVSDKVYLKSGTQVATGDSGTYDAKTQTMTLVGKKVVLSDGENVATGCKLTANTGTSRAFLESCKGQPGRVSIILAPKSAQQQGNRAGSAKSN
ncbi:LPS ABC transporter substrate-binding protein LptA [Phyllobacterium salinisoli]|uniref:LPS ABC transporter substrate-binding protein LptA n=2 Tax=Phyllobacterium salinisoli TaxID=1899321 RepID=A0A368K745_9HYPH|nr:LptA/OstA family protein [Phyllobacterium salinisoli]RCS25208.1 LPS ABC transporter substrate-binding protein LptA [Phyllobacterium salinisoli]